mmetsp:Transcript_29165/g.86601  ORF Transcript_29165/g.86601 Transcript_29165/m.86601 type:complete len:287 (+) Transcript_29165:130-990(+)
MPPSSSRRSLCSNFAKPGGVPSSSNVETSGVLKPSPVMIHLSRHSERVCRTAGVRSPSITLRWGSMSSMWSSMGASMDMRLPRHSSVALRTFHCWCRRFASSEAIRGLPARLTRSPSKCWATFFVISQHSFLASGHVSVSAFASASMMSLAKGFRLGPHTLNRCLRSCRISRRSSSLCSGKGSVLSLPSSAARRSGSMFSSSSAGMMSTRRRVMRTESSLHFSVASENIRKRGLCNSSRKSRRTNSAEILPPDRSFSSFTAAFRRTMRSASDRQLMSRRTVSRNSW